MGRVRIDLFGGFLAIRGDGTPLAVSGRKGQAILAFLLLTRGKPVPRARLATTFWGDRPDEQARNSLRQEIAILREAFGSDCPVVIGPEALSIPDGAVETDLEPLMARPAALLPSDVAALARGDFLDGLDLRDKASEGWLADARQGVHRRRARALIDTALALERRGDPGPAIETAHALVGLDPADEEATRILMRCYAASGRKSSALRAFRALEAALSAELGVAPDPETLALRAAVEGGRVAASPTAVPAAGGRSRLAVYVAPLACEPGDETMADDLGRRVTTGMSLFSVLSVIPAAFAGRKTGADGAAFADALRVGAGYLLTGALCRAGWSRHVTVGCIETRSGAMIWSGLYDFVEPDVVARRICGNLYQPLMRRATETARSAEDMSEVERLYLEAFHHVERPSRVGVRDARRLCLKVLELDPDHALCREHLAWLDFHAGFNGWCDDPVHALKRARENALVGVARADHEPYLLSALGLAEIYMGRGKAGLGWLERAVALNPNDVELHTWLGTGLGFLGHAREAHAAFDAADRISPGYVPVDHFRGDTFLVEGDWTSAISCFDRMLAALPEHDYARACRAAARAAIGDIAGAREDMAIVRAGSPALSTDWLRRLFVHRPGFLPRLAPHFRTAGLSTTAGSP